ncbi:MAG: hypothetical protein ACOY82_06240 [Pseudomonadota bacterium]
MELFLSIVTSFPTVVYTVLLLVVLVHWLLSALGILEVDTVDGLMPDGFGGHGLGHGHDLGGHAIGGHDIGAHHHVGIHHHIDANHLGGAHHPHHDSDGSEAGGLLMKFGLHGVPVMVIFTIIAIVGWSFCFFVDQYLLRKFALGMLTLPAEIATLVGGLVVSIPVARIVLAPVRRLMRRFAPVSQRPMLGRYGIVRSPEITGATGTVEIDDGGAGLILQARVDGDVRFVRGDRVVLIEYLERDNAYRVISGEEFERL